ncbi:hypothetical protein PIB30_063651 [Stylosanthes scabra]|uniref:Retrotransposon gag protein n=1 Tax=Stylosanthes scabra TaxID=79078 RepID=A0ABU6WJW1_9FABA|nr:hypothetical protein [Stylosanthes scabra]
MIKVSEQKIAEILINNEGEDESNEPQLTSENGVDQENQTPTARGGHEGTPREAASRSRNRYQSYRTWKPSTIGTKLVGREKSKYSFSPEILAEELLKKFKYPLEIEPYDGTTDPKHHLDAFENRMMLVNATDVIQCKAFTKTLKKDALTWFNSLPPNSIEPRASRKILQPGEGSQRPA